MDHQQHDSKMMWGMLLACALPILFISIVGSGRKSAIVWGVVGLGLMVFFHWVVMRWLQPGKKTEHPPGMASDQTHHQSPDVNKPACH